MRRAAAGGPAAAAGGPAAAGSAGGGKAAGKGPGTTLAEIQRLQKERDERRKAMEQFKSERAAEEQRNKDNGQPGDVDFQRMIRGFRIDAAQMPSEEDHRVNEDKICICVRKRPISQKEVRRNDHDSVSCSNPIVIVHDCKLKVDGISKYLDNTFFEVDHAFDENCSTTVVYRCAVQPLVSFVASGGRATVFAYGQTGSGKTYSMQGIQTHVVEDLFDLLTTEDDYAGVQVFVSYFEIYGGRCQDLLNNRQRLNVREDGSGEVIVGDLEEFEADSPEALQAIVDTGNRNRTTHATESNDESSRSHAICQIVLRVGEKQVGKLSLIDLAGSERGADTKSHNRQRRLEGAEINKSLLALKECIRALDSNSSHVPYRGSKLTLVLKDSFTRESSRTVMIANVSPAASSADHTLNTLRYADRIKERTVGGQAAANRQGNNKSPLPPSAAGGASPVPLTANAVPAAVKMARPAPQPVAESKGDDPKSRAALQSVFQAKQAMKENVDDQLPQDAEEDLHENVQHIFEEEEALLNLHMNIIQENAELLTEEGRLLQQIQKDDQDIDAYSERLSKILERKQSLISTLQAKLQQFRSTLSKEESQFRQTLKGNC